MLSSPILLLLSFVTTLTFALTTAQSSDIDLIISPALENGTLVGSSVTCFAQPPGKTYVSPPWFQKCGVALRYLPQSTVTGTFHTGGAYDPFRLPVSKAFGSCTILIETANGGSSTDTATWNTVGLAAVQLAMACTPVTDTSAGYGGLTYTGSTNGIKVTIMGTPKVEGNGTAEA